MISLTRLSLLLLLLIATPQPVAATSPYRVVAPPSISAVEVDRVLCARHSPTCGQGAAFWQAAVAAGVDPAVWLAIFVLESNAATDGGVSDDLRNPGNLRCQGAWARAHRPCAYGYRQYPRWQPGASDLATVLANVYSNDDVASMQYRYAPAGDCNPNLCNDPARRGQVATALIRQWRAEDRQH